jgi:hypothetical protein
MPPAATFVTDRVFDRIPRTRIAALSAAPGRLEIRMVCDCHASAFLFRPDRLVIDIRDGPPRGADYAPEEPTVRSVLRLPLLAPDGTGDAFLFDARLIARPAAAPAVESWERAMFGALARAATQGLVDLRPPVLPTLQDGGGGSEAPAPVVLPDSGLFPPPMEAAPDRNGPGLVMFTGLDQVRWPAPAEGRPARCLTDQDFDVAAWAGGEDFARAIGDRTAALTTDRDLYPDGAIESLARAYIHFGFGIEAQQVLGLDGRRSAERDLLSAMADVVDGNVGQTDFFRSLAGCPGAAALWRALEADTLDGFTAEERADVLTAFRALPDPLRRSFGPRLAPLFVAAGEPLVARSVLETAAISGAAGPAQELGAAAVDLAGSRPEEGLARLAQLAGKTAPPSPEVLLALVAATLAQGGTPDEGTLLLLQSVRFEHRGEPIERELARAEARVLSALHRHREALALAGAPPLGDDPESDTLREDLARALAADPDEGRFLLAAFGDLPARIPAAGINAIAERLIAAGFATEGLALLAPATVGPAMAERRYLRATGWAALGRPDLVEGALSGLADPRAQAIRAEAMRRAAATMLPIPAGPGSGPSAASPEGAEAPTAAAAPGGPLAAGAALIGESEATRARIGDLLARTASDLSGAAPAPAVPAALSD